MQIVIFLLVVSTMQVNCIYWISFFFVFSFIFNLFISVTANSDYKSQLLREFCLNYLHDLFACMIARNGFKFVFTCKTCIISESVFILRFVCWCILHLSRDAVVLIISVTTPVFANDIQDFICLKLAGISAAIHFAGLITSLHWILKSVLILKTAYMYASLPIFGTLPNFCIY